MDANYIAYEALIASRDAALWARWSTIAAWLGGLTTIVTLYFAYKALSTWRDQEKTKVKLEFRVSIKHLKNSLIFMAHNIDPKEIEEKREQVTVKCLFKDDDLLMQQIETGEHNVQKFDQMLSLFDSCQSSWLATEHLFDGSTLAADWEVFQDDFEKYINGELSKSPLMQMLNKITSARFVFESK